MKFIKKMRALGRRPFIDLYPIPFKPVYGKIWILTSFVTRVKEEQFPDCKICPKVLFGVVVETSKSETKTETSPSETKGETSPSETETKTPKKGLETVLRSRPGLATYMYMYNSGSVGLF